MIEQILRKFTDYSFRKAIITFLACTGVAVFAAASPAQTPSPSPTGSPDPDNRFEVTASTEIGARWVDVNGNENKFRSDLNYRNGFRVFDSSIYIEDKGEGYKAFDSALIVSSGWGADPSGFLRVNLEREGAYRLDTNIRRVSFFNSLNNHALNQHDVDTQRTFGDVDLVIFPESRNFRVRLGYSLNTIDGNAGYSTRAFRDEFPVTSLVSSVSNDFRAGVDTRVLGFNLNLLYGYRRFNEDTNFILPGLSLGNNPNDTTRLFTFQRQNPVDGDTNFGVLGVQRTFAKKLDFTARILHSVTKSDFTLFETLTGIDNANNQIDLDRFEISGDAKRPQTRADAGVTYAITDNFRISDTFTFDQFNIGGGNIFAEALFSRTAAGVTRPDFFSNTLANRITSYRRFVNTIEGDYQFNDRIGFNIGYRYTQRKTTLQGLDSNFTSGSSSTFAEEFDNNTHTVIAGMKVKPTRNWAIYWDVERGRADNVFTRLANNRFTNFRVRSRTNFNKLALNFSFITKNNLNPSRDVEDVPQEFAADVRNRIFSGSIDWDPINELSISGGYTYNYLTSETDIIVPVGQRLQGLSQFFMRDHYGFVDVTARPFRRVTLFASYRINEDRGQGDRISLLPQDIITSYPLTYQSPEVRLAIKLNRYIDWNVGYQYFNYRERLQAVPQNYNAHLPYTSIRIYLGRTAGDR